MTRAQIFPTAIIALSAGASVMYFIAGDWRKGLYWAFATGIGVVMAF
jgi:hypothetical protein